MENRINKVSYDEDKKAERDEEYYYLSSLPSALLKEVIKDLSINELASIFALVQGQKDKQIIIDGIRKKLPNVNYLHMYILDFSELNLSGIDLSNLNLSGTNFKDTDLSNANLENTNLSNTNLKAVNFLNANLEKANLNGAKFFAPGELKFMTIEDLNSVLDQMFKNLPSRGQLIFKTALAKAITSDTNDKNLLIAAIQHPIFLLPKLSIYKYKKPEYYTVLENAIKAEPDFNNSSPNMYKRRS